MYITKETGWHPFVIVRTLSSNWPKFPKLSLKYNTVGAQKNQNSLKSRFNTPGWEEMTTLDVQESLFINLLTHWMILMTYSNFNSNSYVSTTVLCIKSYITLGQPAIGPGKSRHCLKCGERKHFFKKMFVFSGIGLLISHTLCVLSVVFCVVYLCRLY